MTLFLPVMGPWCTVINLIFELALPSPLPPSRSVKRPPLHRWYADLKSFLLAANSALRACHSRSESAVFFLTTFQVSREYSNSSRNLAKSCRFSVSSARKICSDSCRRLCFNKNYDQKMHKYIMNKTNGPWLSTKKNQTKKHSTFWCNSKEMLK